MNLISIPALQDNYIWLLSDQNRHCIIVDPGDAQPVLRALKEHCLTPDAVLLTHHHRDHVGGVAEIKQQYKNIPIFGPEETKELGSTHIVADGDRLTLLNSEFSVISVPGHTLGHVAYYAKPYLFCGDTLFSAGCGRLFEGTPEQMYHSLQRLAALPDETLVCCAHEYTLSNITFAHAVWPENSAIEASLREIKRSREKGQASLPVTLKSERVINLFLRCHDADLQRKLNIEPGKEQDWRIFALLRSKKDSF
ncbi:hydroxyacylglutathione hydrolase [Affinibrenneria salicis]|uniref:Hydroxyacylglutathione hydrolase n=1 Tax=Affinibrenneria salicis TaxID=2590031 RepID=A0A5J5FS63_9GAMM|nr:hydroxyacylglutathione hydrolase [Affinibrenneria salicis]KAA8995911.1 hydroxyacylglutathione hydrolase [Affinibrenneria salicis]